MTRRLLFLMVTMSLILLNHGGSALYAQAPQTIEVGPHIGVTTYAGDLNVWRNLSQWDWKKMNQFHYDWGAVVRFNYDSRWAFRLDYTHLRLRACDSVAAWRPQGNLNFKSTVDDLSFIVEFNFLDYYTGKRDKSISPYVFAGVSGLMYYVQPFTGVDTLDAMYINGLHEGANGADVFSIGETRKGRYFALSIPFGVGCKLSVSEHLAATVEWRTHYTLTDYLDGVHGNYTAPEGYQRGNARTNDWFGMLNLSLTWKFVIPNKTACKMIDN